MANDFYHSSCGAGMIRGRLWEPVGFLIGVIQLVHGIAEHVERYDDFAEFLATQGYLVVAQDHMGHGKSCDGYNKGYFSGGWFNAVQDTYQLLNATRKKYHDLPYILFEHSMGSFFSRTILIEHPDSGISGCIICGTGWMPVDILSLGKAAATAISGIIGEEKPSKILQTMMFGGYNKRVEHQRTEYGWLTRGDTVVDAYVTDPFCGFTPSAGLVRDMMCGMLYIQRPDTLQKMDMEIPIYFISGSDDPVDNYGEGVLKTAEKFKGAGVRDVTIKLYPLCRHEILNEINKLSVYQDVISWINRI